MGRPRNKDLNYVPVIAELTLPANDKLEKEQKRQKADYNRKVNKSVLISETIEKFL